jgi:hypothetical protein
MSDTITSTLSLCLHGLHTDNFNFSKYVACLRWGNVYISAEFDLYTGCSAWVVTTSRMLVYESFWVNNAISTYARLSTVTSVWAFYCFTTLCATVRLQGIVDSADRIRGNEEITSKATNSLLRRAELCIRGWMSFWTVISVTYQKNWRSLILVTQNRYILLCSNITDSVT